jgi:hypothetical protein
MISVVTLLGGVDILATAKPPRCSVTWARGYAAAFEVSYGNTGSGGARATRNCEAREWDRRLRPRPLAPSMALGASVAVRPSTLRFRTASSTRSVFHVWPALFPSRSTNRTAVYGPVRTVV